jgi:hypothetical protein
LAELRRSAELELGLGPALAHHRHSPQRFLGGSPAAASSNVPGCLIEEYPRSQPPRQSMQPRPAPSRQLVSQRTASSRKVTRQAEWAGA